ncbi:MAG: DnaJ domain-containing protein [Planctomycetota bacterium]|nr:DnaJ domain-containing protein [Planctomycetota bacterium]
MFSAFTKSSRKPSGTDKRKAERHSTNSLSCHLGIVLDVSSSGMQVRCDRKPPVKVGQVIEAKLDTGSQRVPVQAQIVWIKRLGFTKTYTVGIRFINVSRSVQAAVESLAMFGYVDLEAAAQARQQKIGDPYKGRSAQIINASVELPDYYAVLGVSRGATERDIKKAFHILARKYHPDIARSEIFTKNFTEVNEAYAVLRDNAKRRTYDLRRTG